MHGGANCKRTRASTDIIESELSHERVELEEKREGLADTAGGTKNGDLGELPSQFLSANAID